MMGQHYNKAYCKDLKSLSRIYQQVIIVRVLIISSTLNVLDWLLDFHSEVMQMYFLASLDVEFYQSKRKHQNNIKIYKLFPRIFCYSFLPQKAYITVALLNAKAYSF